LEHLLLINAKREQQRGERKPGHKNLHDTSTVMSGFEAIRYEHKASDPAWRRQEKS
jgi:hypothetical protein